MGMRKRALRYTFSNDKQRLRKNRRWSRQTLILLQWYPNVLRDNPFQRRYTSFVRTAHKQAAFASIRMRRGYTFVPRDRNSKRRGFSVSFHILCIPYQNCLGLLTCLQMQAVEKSSSTEIGCASPRDLVRCTALTICAAFIFSYFLRDPDFFGGMRQIV